MKEQVEAAVAWWVEQLSGKPVQHDAGDPLINAGIDLFGRDPFPESPLRIAKFKKYLTMACMMDFSDSWKPDQPAWGSANRTLGCDYGPGPLLRLALDLAGIDQGNLRLPIKTIMWVSPNEVKVRCGYRGREEVIWPEEGSSNE